MHECNYYLHTDVYAYVSKRFIVAVMIGSFLSKIQKMMMHSMLLCNQSHPFGQKLFAGLSNLPDWLPTRCILNLLYCGKLEKVSEVESVIQSKGSFMYDVVLLNI